MSPASEEVFPGKTVRNRSGPRILSGSASGQVRPHTALCGHGASWRWCYHEPGSRLPSLGVAARFVTLGSCSRADMADGFGHRRNLLHARRAIHKLNWESSWGLSGASQHGASFAYPMRELRGGRHGGTNANSISVCGRIRQVAIPAIITTILCPLSLITLSSSRVGAVTATTAAPSGALKMAVPGDPALDKVSCPRCRASAFRGCAALPGNRGCGAATLG